MEKEQGCLERNPVLMLKVLSALLLVTGSQGLFHSMSQTHICCNVPEHHPQLLLYLPRCLQM